MRAGSARQDRTGMTSGAKLTRAPCEPWRAARPDAADSARQSVGVASLAVSALEFARHRPEIAIAVIDIRALPDLAFDRLGLAESPGIAPVQGQGCRLAVAHLGLVKLGIFVGHPHQALFATAPGG